MSFQAINWAYSQRTGCPVCQSILAKLADWADEKTWEAYPAIGKIAEQTGYCIRSVRNHLRHLESFGLIETKFQYRPHGEGQRASLYLLNPGRPPATNAAPTASGAGGGGTAFRPPRQEMPRYIEEPPIEPSMNLPPGVALPIEDGRRRLADDIGTDLSDAWFGDAIFEPGPPVTILASRPFKAQRMREYFDRQIERAFGKGVVIAVQSSRPSTPGEEVLRAPRGG